MAARQRKALKRDAIAANRCDELIGELVRKRGIVTATDRQDFFARAVQPRDIWIWTDGRKIAAHFVERNFVVQGLPDIRSGEAGGNNVAKICRDMQERPGAQSGFMG